MAIRGAARAVARAARCGSAGLRPAAPAASETRTAAVFILHWTCVRSVSSSDLVSPAACRDCSPMAQRVVRFCSLVMLSGSLRRSVATIAGFSDRFDGVRFLRHEQCVPGGRWCGPQGCFTVMSCMRLLVSYR